MVLVMDYMNFLGLVGLHMNYEIGCDLIITLFEGSWLQFCNCLRIQLYQLMESMVRNETKETSSTLVSYYLAAVKYMALVLHTYCVIVFIISKYSWY